MDMLKNSDNKRRPSLQSSNSFPQPSGASVPHAPSGMALLDSIFASAVPNNTASHSASQADIQHLHSLRTAGGDASINESMIYSPKPSSAILPQILTADVIHELMGMPRSESSTSSSYSPSSTGAGAKKKVTKDKDRGYIADRGEDDGLSESSNGCEPDVDVEEDERLKNSRVAATSISRSTFLSAGSSSSSINLKGDTTPRARSERGLEPMKVQSRESILDLLTATSSPRVKSPGTKPPARRAAERTISESTITTSTLR